MDLPDNLLVWLAVVLAAVEVTLAALAIGLALFAIFGRRAVLSRAEREAREAAEKEVRARLNESNLREMVSRAVREEGNALFHDIQMTGESALNETGDESK